MSETKLDPSFPNSQFLIPGFHQPMRLDITSKRGGMLVYIKSSFPSRIMSNFQLPENIQVTPFELNLRKENWLFVSVDKPPLQSNNYFLNTLNDLLDFYSGIYDNGVRTIAPDENCPLDNCPLGNCPLDDFPRG